MPNKPDRPKELEALSRKVREAGEVIGHLRDSNRALTSELEEMKLRLTDAGRLGTTEEDGPEAELALLRRERTQIRERIVQLLEQLEAISSTPSAE